MVLVQERVHTFTSADYYLYIKFVDSVVNLVRLRLCLRLVRHCRHHRLSVRKQTFCISPEQRNKDEIEQREKSTFATHSKRQTMATRRVYVRTYSRCTYKHEPLQLKLMLMMIYLSFCLARAQIVIASACMLARLGVARANSVDEDADDDGGDDDDDYYCDDDKRITTFDIHGNFFLNIVDCVLGESSHIVY